MSETLDLSYLADLAHERLVESLSVRGFRLDLLRAPRSSARHQARYLYRLLAYPASSLRPSLSIGVEVDILGDCLLTEESARGRRILARYDAEPGWESFRARALEAAERELSALRRGPRRADDRRSGASKLG